MASRSVGDVGRVLEFGRTLMPMSDGENMKGLGLERDGQLVAGVLYEGFNGQNGGMHAAGAPGSKWMTRDYLRYCFQYPFNEMGVKRVSGYVNASNTAARRLDEHLGFKPEATLTGAAPDGGDVILYAMWRKDCRYV